MPKNPHANGETEDANPTDDFDPSKNLGRVLKLKAKVQAAEYRAEAAKAALKETEVYAEAKNTRETHKGLAAELDDLLAELGREYPLFERREA